MNMNYGEDFDQVAGTFTIDGSFTHINGTDSFLGGTVVGQPVLRHTTLDFDTVGFADAADIRLEGTNNLTTDVPAATTLRLFGASGGSTQTLNVDTASTFAGTTEITSSGGGYSSHITVTGGNFQNQGLVEALPGAGGIRKITADTENSGTINLQGTNLTMQGATTNLAGGRFTGTGSLIPNSTILNDGVFAPGSEVGTLGVTGSWTQSASGRLAIDVGGLVAGTDHDKLTVSSTATLGGELRLASFNGFTPQFGDTFEVLTAGTISGTFDTVRYQGILNGDNRIELVYFPTSVIAQVVHKNSAINPSEVPLSLSDPTPGVAGQQNIFEVSGAAGLGSVELVYGTLLGTTPTASCAGLDFGIDSAIVLGSAPVSRQGNALLQVTVPAGLAGTTAYFQVVDMTNCKVTNLVTFLFP